MPLKPGESPKTFNYNVKELMATYKETGKIGNSKPPNRAKALKQALAIAYEKKR